MKRKSGFYFAMLCAVLLVGCSSQGDDNNDHVPPDAGTDTVSDTGDDTGDENNGEELPVSDDYDGDGYSNDDELYKYGFDSSNDPYKFNPLVADVPRIRISLVSAPEVTLSVSSTTSGSKEITTGTEVGYSNTVTRSQSHSTSTTIETVVSEHRETLRLGPLTLSSPQATRDTSRTTTEEESFAWSQSQAATNSEKHSEARAIRQEKGFTFSGGELKVSVEIENTGHIAYTLSNLALSAHEYRFSGEDLIYPIGNLEFDSTSGVFPSTTLGPGETLGPLVFVKDDLPLNTALSLWKDSRGLVIRPSTYQLTDENNVSFNHNLTTIMARTATVIIDYGPSVQRPTEHHSVATILDPENPGITFAEALTDHLYLPYETNADGLNSVRGVQGQPDDGTEWLVTHFYREGGEDRYEIYSVGEESVDFDSLILKAGNVLHLTYLDDTDRDGLYAREEAFYGTDPEKSDSDDDGIPDGREAHGYEVPGLTLGGAVVRTDPNNYDSDGDGISDGDELSAGTDPTSWFPFTLSADDGFDANKSSVVKDAALDAYGNLYVVGQRNRVGSSSSPPVRSTWALRKVAPDGTPHPGWADQNPTGGMNLEHSAEALAMGPDGSLYVVGYFTYERNEWGIKKFNLAGDEVTTGWDKTIGAGEGKPARAHAVAVDSGGYVYVAGYAERLADDTSGKDWWIKKFDSAGNEVSEWEQVFDDGNRDDLINAVAVDGNDSLIVAGYSTDAAGNRFWRVRKYTSAGALSWDETFAQPGDDIEATDVAVDENNNIYVVGYEEDDLGSRWRIKKYLTSGQEDAAWDIDYARSQGLNKARAVTTDSAGNVYVVGLEQGQGQANTNWRIMRLAPNGAVDGDDWSFDFINQGIISANAVAVGEDGDVYVAGHVDSGSFGSYWHLRKHYGLIE